jgi:large repetitive protein
VPASSQSYNLSIVETPLTLGPGSLPDGKIGVVYRQRFTASGGTAPYTFVVDGALPPGLSLSSTGVLSGKPTAVGFFYFSIAATDANSRKGHQFYALSITQVSLTLSPSALPDGKVGVAYRQRFTASGGTAPYTFAIPFGELPPGLSLSPDGWLRGRPTRAGTNWFSVQVTDAHGNIGGADYMLAIVQVLEISPQYLPSGLAGTPYRQSLVATGGTAPYTFAVAEGALPPGLALSPAGVLSGTPTRPGYSGFVVVATDSRGKSGSHPYYIGVGSPIVISPPALLDAKVGSVYSQQLGASGGTAPYTFVVTDGVLPPGLALSPAGVLSGTPTSSDLYGFTVGATDSRGIGATQFYTLAVAQAVLISPRSLPGATLDEAYAVSLAASGGTAPYRFAITEGTLPAGITLRADRLLGGTPAAPETTFFTITATDAAGRSGHESYGLAINRPLITVGPANLPGGQVGAAYSQQLMASGGTAPYLFIGESLPAGLTLMPSGVLRGTPTNAGFYSMSISVVDARGSTAGVLYDFTVDPIAVDPPSLPDAVVGAAYSQQLTASGGTGPYAFVVAPFSWLPSGLSLSRSGLLSGRPRSEGVYDTSVQVIDANGYTSRRYYSLAVVGPLAIGPDALPEATARVAYSQQLRASGGAPPYSFSVTDGDLPPGLSLSDSGELSGTPALSGIFPVTITLADQGGRTVERAYTLVVN